MAPPTDEILVHPFAQTNVLSVRAKALIFADPKSRELLERIEQFAPSDAAVLVTGETGTGKELVARHLHRHSGRHGDFVAVNCGALVETMAEAELFGHTVGAFTGATDTRAGWFEAANGGTLFLDEVGDLPLPLQVKLLRVLQEREVYRVGSRKPVPLNVRIIAGTNVDLTAAVAAEHFRRDLYYRLNVVTLHVPTLAERPGDILPLASHFIRLYGQRLHADVPRLSTEAQRALLQYPWPGNIRELENVVHVALLTARDGVIRAEDLRFPATPLRRLAQSVDTGEPWDIIDAQLDRLFAAGPRDLHAQWEARLLRRAYGHTHGNQLATARLLDISRNIVRAGLKRIGMLR
jgi:DNA-binding NtrC family response regulator